MIIGLYHKQVLAFRKSNGNSPNTDKNKTLQSDSMSFSRLKCDQKVTLRGLNVIVMSVIYCKQEHIGPRFNFDPFALVVIG